MFQSVPRQYTDTECETSCKMYSGIQAIHLLNYIIFSAYIKPDIVVSQQTDQSLGPLWRLFDSSMKCSFTLSFVSNSSMYCVNHVACFVYVLRFFLSYWDHVINKNLTLTSLDLLFFAHQ